jgi:hypothetical protein
MNHCSDDRTSRSVYLVLAESLSPSARAVRGPTISNVKSRFSDSHPPCHMKTRDRILGLFEEDLARALWEFGKSLSKIDANLVVFLARKSLCLYDALLASGIPPINRCVLSDRALDFRLDTVTCFGRIPFAASNREYPKATVYPDVGLRASRTVEPQLKQDFKRFSIQTDTYTDTYFPLSLYRGCHCTGLRSRCASLCERSRRTLGRASDSHLALIPFSPPSCWLREEREAHHELLASYLRTAEGWLFLAAILDAWSRRLVGRLGLRSDPATQEELGAPLAFIVG